MSESPGSEYVAAAADPIRAGPLSVQSTVTPAISDELLVMMCPVSSFHRLRAARGPVVSRTWMLIRRPLASTCFVGAFVSFAVTGRLVAPMIADGMLWWSFIPVLQAGYIALTLMLFGRGSMTFVRAIDLFFVGQGPLFLWLLMISTITAIAPDVFVARLSSHGSPFLIGSAVVTLVWVNATTFGFLRGAAGLPAACAAFATVMYAAALWATFAFYLFAVDLLPYYR